MKYAVIMEIQVDGIEANSYQTEVMIATVEIAFDAAVDALDAARQILIQKIRDQQEENEDLAEGDT